MEIETSRQSTLDACLKKKREREREDPQPETSSEKSNHERSVQGPCGVYKTFGLGFEHIKVNVQNLILYFIKCSLIIYYYI